MLQTPATFDRPAGIDPIDEDDEQPVGDLVGQLFDDAKGYAQAEIELAKVKAMAEAVRLVRPALLGGVAALFGMAAVVVLCMTIADSLATVIGPLAGGLVATLVALAVAAGLGLAAKKALDR